MKKILLFFVAIGILVPGIAGMTLLIPNTYGEWAINEIKVRGYYPYTPDEAIELAYTRCTTCHDEVKMLKYCSRCGPPFIVVVHFMKNHIEIARKKGKDVKQLTDAEIVAIVQVWNALIGNWDDDWRKEDLEKMLEGDDALLALLATPIEDRPIEAALRGNLAPGAYKTEYQLGSGQDL